jgi:hypothetical protein
MSIDIIKQQTKDLIDRLKSTTNNIGLGNSGNEYTVIVETFLYKFLNDKFIYEAKRTYPHASRGVTGRCSRLRQQQHGQHKPRLRALPWAFRWRLD